TASLGISAFLLSSQASSEKSTNPAPKLKLSDAPVSRDTRLTTSFAPVIKKVSPSVVNIYSTRTVKENLRMMPLMDDPFFRRFFGDDEGPRDNRRPRSRQEQSLGSGVIVSEDGYILTNNHVVEGADEIKVVLADDKKEYEAKIIGTDPQTDIAVLKVEDGKLPVVTIADSDKLEVGDVVLALGNPFGVGQTVTMGIVSATGRGVGILGQEGYEDFIQTDASINPGNSGGALMDADGRLVGINTAILSRTGGNQGVGFAVPINLARFVMDRIIRDGKVSRGQLGVGIQPVTPDLAEEFNLPAEQRGALIGQVLPESPAEKAGLKEGDVVIEFNGKPVTDSRHFRLMVAQTAPDTEVTLKVLRDSKEKSLTATLGELSEKESAKGLRRPAEPESSRDTLDGVEVSDLDSRSRRQYDIPDNVRGVIVTNVDPESPSYRKGIRPGDVILEVDRKPVRNADDAVRLGKNLNGSVLLRVWRNGGTSYVVVDSARQRK
ncbi:MAG TPA: DegQ family serine endoprotease, partial [Verrucomicrobiae bacterium]|nr:DegQ family serine endoprotease [Verrucomicrobiae bacterium]